MQVSRREVVARSVAMLFFLFLLLLSATSSLERIDAYSLSEYFSALSKALSQDVYFESEESILSSLERGIRSQDRYFRLIRTEREFQRTFQEYVGPLKKKYGIFFDRESGRVELVFKHSPNSAVLQKGDRLLEVESEKDPSKFLSVFESHDRVRAVIERNGERKEVVLSAFEMKPFYCERTSETEQTLTIYFFRTEMVASFYQCLQEIKKSPRVRKITIDLSQSPGGSVRALSAVLSFFFPEKTLLFQERRKNEIVNYYSQGGKKIDLERYDVKILKSSMTASSAEIFIAVLKHYFDHVQLEGQKTYGKFTTVRLIKFFKGGAVVSVGKVYLPDGMTYEGVGL